MIGERHWIIRRVASALILGLALILGWKLDVSWLAGVVIGLVAMLCRRHRLLRQVVPVLLGATLGLFMYAQTWWGIGGVIVGVGVAILGGLAGWKRGMGRERQFRSYGQYVFICQGQACRMRGAELLRIAAIARTRGRDIRVTGARCLGFCPQAPTIWCEPAGLVYTRVRLEELIEVLFDGKSHAH